MSTPIPIKTEEVILEHAEYNSAEELEDEIQLQLEDSGGESSYVQYQSEHQDEDDSSRKSLNGSKYKSNMVNSTINKAILDSEKRMRREIANSNERRRMQSINAGFQNLRSLLPRQEGEKLSKAAILQQTSAYICELENEKTQLLAQNSQLKRQLGQHESSSAGGGEETAGGVAIKKRKLTDNVINIQTISDSSDEGLGSMSPEPMTLLNASSAAGGKIVGANLLAQNAKELLEIKKQLEKERRLRTTLEDELQMIKRHLYSVATAPQAVITGSTSYIPHEVIEHTDNIIRENLDELPPGTVSYVEIDELTGQQQVVVCSSIEEIETDGTAGEIITEETVHEEVNLSSSTESEHEVNVNAIAKAYIEGTPTAASLQPILQAAIKATPKVEVERINESIVKVKTEKIDQTSGLTRSRQNLETIVEAIRHLEGDHCFEGNNEQKLQAQQKSQESPLALTTKQQQAQRTTLAELRPFLTLKGNRPVKIISSNGGSLTVSSQALSTATAKVKAAREANSKGITSLKVENKSATTPTPTALYKVQTTSQAGSGTTNKQITITTSALKQCRPGVIVAKQLS